MPVIKFSSYEKVLNIVCAVPNLKRKKDKNEFYTEDLL